MKNIRHGKTMNDYIRLQKIIQKSSFDSKGCLNFNGWVRPDGYGMIRRLNKCIYVHRFVYEMEREKISNNLTVDHLCRNRKCVNINHLEVVTNKTNILRGVGPTAKNKQKTHCKNGHLLQGCNLKLEKLGGRRCLICKKEYDKNYHINHTQMNNKICRQGDVDLRIIKTIPKSAKLIQNKTIMYGEATGHHHTFNGQVLVYEPQEPQFLEINGEQSQIQKYVEVQETAQLTHQEHETLEIPKGVYAVLQEREYDPLEQQILRVRD